MNTTEQTISKNSIWLTATPAPFAKTLPFYLTEAGMFETSENYAVSRGGGGGFLLFYTIGKSGVLEQNGRIVDLPENHAAIPRGQGRVGFYMVLHKRKRSAGDV